ncbi:hypothetical protein T05_11005 [Trichinella murrelli]|uniref:Uncharacterized protein n=1 Tax=Trichinella murrelli TaxID=144512 RepID=A0A0V0UDW0_9BILA|nr:hypothetical protein T05_11005 [Trichinella murrelli]
MSKIRQDRRSQQSTEKPLSSKQSTEQSNNIDYDAFRLIPYQHIVHIYTHSEKKNLLKRTDNHHLLILLYILQKIPFLRGGEVDYEGTLVENKRIEIKPQLRISEVR